MLRIAKILLVLSVVFWGLVGAFLNVAHWSDTLGAVGAATSMSTFEGGPEAFQAVNNPVITWLGALFIMLSKLTAAVLCGIGAQRMFAARGGDAAAFNAAKDLALTGCAVAAFMLFAGFIVIAESWFELWKSDAMRDPVLGSAFRYGGFILLIGLFVGQKDD